MPTAAQIEAAVARPTYQVRVHDGSSWVDVSADVAEVSGDLALSTGQGGIFFGLAPAPTQQVRFTKERFGLQWDRSPIEIRLGFEGSNDLHFLGLIDELDQGRRSGTWNAVGFPALLQAIGEVRSPLLYRRPVFTATTLSSQEDPDLAGYAGGPGNLILWRAGGRPLPQAASYPGAVFYYSCETAILAPEWSWLNGGDAARAIDELCRVAGGVVYQDTSGVVRYQEPMTFAQGAPLIHYTDSAAAVTAAGRVAGGLAQYGDARRRGRTRRTTVDVVRCNFVQRRLQGTQEIYSDQTPRLIEAGQSLDLTLDLQLPHFTLSRVVAEAATIRGAAPVTAAQLTVAVTARNAQRIEVTLTNTLAEAVGLAAVRAIGQPLVAGEEGSASHGSPAGDYPRAYGLPDSPYIQSRSHAQRLCHLYWDFMHEPRPTVELLGCGYDPRRQLGERILLTVSDWGLAAAPHRIVAIRPSRTGRRMDLTVVPVDGLPVASDFFQNGQSYADADVRQLIY